MDATSLVFSGSHITEANVALEGLMAQIRTTQDSGISSGPNARAPINIWQAVAKGRGLPDFRSNGIIHDVQEYQAPCVLVFDDSDENISEDAHFDETYSILRVTLVQLLYVEFDGAGNYPDMVPIQRNMKDATLAHLWRSNFNQIFPWMVESPQRVPTDFSGVVSRFEYKVEPPWWACETQLSLNVWRAQNT